MPTISETSLSLLSQSDPPTLPWTFIAILLVIGVAAAGFYYASPTRLTGVLVSALINVENAYLASEENGLAHSDDVDIEERLTVLQLEVCTFCDTSLRVSLSPIFPLSVLYDMFNIRRSIAVLRCLREVRSLGTHIEIFHEAQRREITSTSEASSQCPLTKRASISLRRRDTARSAST
ncbi:hypothetical protein MSAN_00676200 [Mycena sanguinolenta]|uniref:Uncharacterized protein n=1 Tax=Mycena sanguinolenta TaxID=230812 RepID=A0A8H6Z738_9AGAR|nr:hypothetical protein MSAN_00676200 [Mycena sanguinolenta]